MDRDFSEFEEYNEVDSVDELEELDGFNDSDIFEDRIVEIEDENGVAFQYFHLGDIDYEGKKYAFFIIAEEVEGVPQDEAVVYEVDEELKELLTVEDEQLIDKLFLEFTSNFKGEYIEEKEFN